ncbi:hypothetical protein Glove_374g13 [Diversispora epigaea]|uniref:Uncharacterized protein n=1 Tax=Diversispora epigaea TaxID=1348612 RepID=A0A397H5D8_9GLOM|nr:hypothetical protein Glove_374g13 [Diversispora epigaea]
MKFCSYSKNTNNVFDPEKPQGTRRFGIVFGDSDPIQRSKDSIKCLEYSGMSRYSIPAGILEKLRQIHKSNRTRELGSRKI